MRRNVDFSGERVGIPGAAKRLDMSESAVRRYAEDGLLPCARDHANRRTFLLSDLDAFASRNEGRRANQRIVAVMKHGRTQAAVRK